MTHIHWVDELEHLKIETRLINEKFVSVMGECDIDVMDDPSKLSVIRKAAVLTRFRTTLLLNCWAKAVRRKWNSPLVDCASWTPEAQKSGQFPDERDISAFYHQQTQLVTYLCYKDHYQAFFWVLIDLIVELLGLIIKPFDNQTETWNPVSNDLIIKSFDISFDNQW